MEHSRHYHLRESRGSPSNSDSKEIFRHRRGRSTGRCENPAPRQATGRREWLSGREQSNLLYACASYPLISEVETDEKAAGGQIARGDGRGAALPQDRVFVVKSEARAAGNKWIKAIPDGDSVNVAEVCRVRRQHLARHANRFIPTDQDESRIEVVMRFDQAAVPRGSPRARRKRHVGRSVGAKEGIFPAMEKHRGDVKLFDVPHPDQPGTIEALVASACAGNSRSCRG